MGLGSTAGEQTRPSKRGQKQKLKPRIPPGKRRQTTYQGLINPRRVICTVRPLRIGIKSEEVRIKGKREGEGWEAVIGQRGGLGLQGRVEKGLVLDLYELHCHHARHASVSLISLAAGSSKEYCDHLMSLVTCSPDNDTVSVSLDGSYQAVFVSDLML